MWEGGRETSSEQGYFSCTSQELIFLDTRSVCKPTDRTTYPLSFWDVVQLCRARARTAALLCSARSQGAKESCASGSRCSSCAWTSIAARAHQPATGAGVHAPTHRRAIQMATWGCEGEREEEDSGDCIPYVCLTDLTVFVGFLETSAAGKRVSQ